MSPLLTKSIANAGPKLPGARLNTDVIRVVSRMTSVFSLAPGSLGPALAMDLVKSGDITRVSNDLVKPFYQRKAEQAVSLLKREMGKDIPMRIHKPEGAL